MQNPAHNWQLCRAATTRLLQIILTAGELANEVSRVQKILADKQKESHRSIAYSYDREVHQMCPITRAIDDETHEAFVLATDTVPLGPPYIIAAQ